MNEFDVEAQIADEEMPDVVIDINDMYDEENVDDIMDENLDAPVNNDMIFRIGINDIYSDIRYIFAAILIHL